MRNTAVPWRNALFSHLGARICVAPGPACGGPLAQIGGCSRAHTERSVSRCTRGYHPLCFIFRLCKYLISVLFMFSMSRPGQPACLVNGQAVCRCLREALSGRHTPGKP